MSLPQYDVFLSTRKQRTCSNGVDYFVDWQVVMYSM